jgi:hypothetical protein
MRSLRPLPSTRKQSLAKVDAGDVEITELADAKARAVEHLTDRAVQRRPLVVAPVVVEQVVELLAHHDLGQSVGRARGRRGARPGLLQ